jgi:predicted transposase YbfD/YdcC
VLGQVKTADKSNEITAIPQLLDVLALKGCVVTIDAMGCQKSIAEKIIGYKADYVLALKGNQSRFHSEVKDFFETALAHNFKHVDHKYYHEHDAGHSQVETRECWVITPETGDFASGPQWVNLSSIVMIKSRRDSKGKTSEDTRYYISSITPDASKLLNAVRKHWCVENQLH